MADITMCKGNECTLKSSCYRFLAEKEKLDQTYFGAPPFQITKNLVTCKFYWKIPEDDHLE